MNSSELVVDRPIDISWRAALSRFVVTWFVYSIFRHLTHPEQGPLPEVIAAYFGNVVAFFVIPLFIVVLFMLLFKLFKGRIRSPKTWIFNLGIFFTIFTSIGGLLTHR